MQLRRIFLRIALFGTIATVIAGGTGMFAGSRMEEPAIGSAVILCAFWGVVFAAAFMIDRKALRRGAISLVGVALAGATFGVIACWTYQLGFGYMLQRYLVEAVFFILFLGLPAAGLMLLDSFRGLRFAVRAYAITCAASAAVFLFVIFALGDFGRPRYSNNNEMYATDIYLTGLMISFCLLGWGNKRTTIPRWIGIVCAAAGGIALAMIINSNTSRAEIFPLFFWVLAGGAILGVIVLLAELKPGQIWMRWGTLALGWLTMALAIFLVVAANQYWWNSTIRNVTRVTAAMTFLTVGATIGVLIVWLLNRRTERVVPPPSFSEVDLTCPCCGKRGVIPAGKSACGECGLRFEIKLEDPRCAGCGYLLYRIVSSNCPECGLPIPGNEKGPRASAIGRAFPVDMPQTAPVMPVRPIAQTPPR